MGKAWYIIASRKQDELELLLDRRGIEYFNPTGLQCRVTRQKLQLQEKNVMGGYVFAHLNLDEQYYYLKHNEMFYGNVIAVLGMDCGIAAAATDANEVEEWRSLASAVSVPLRLRFSKGKYHVTNKGLRGARIVHYYRRKLGAVIEVKVAGRVRKLMVAAYDVGNRSAAAVELAAIYKKSNHLLRPGTSSRLKKREIAAFLETVRQDKTNALAEVERAMIKSRQDYKATMEDSYSFQTFLQKYLRKSFKYRMVSYGRWRIAPFSSDWLYVTKHNLAFSQRYQIAG